MATARRFPATDHCDGRQFFNPRVHVNRTWLEVLRWRFTAKVEPWPSHVTMPPPPPLPVAPADGTLTATWIGHATVLLQTRFGAILTDPVFGERASPFGWAGPRRVHPPGVALRDLPPIRLILLSHDHYDHCELASLRHFARQSKPPLVITPLGNAPLLARAGFRPADVVELDWWDAHELEPGFFVRATPARHWSNRISGGRNHRLWSGFFVHAGGRTAYVTGDTAWDDHMFAEVAQRCGSPDLAIIPIGAYEPRWFMAAQHCNPAEAVRIHQTVGAGQSLAVHWGTFQLTDEGREAPREALAAARHAAGLPETAFQALDPGGSLRI